MFSWEISIHLKWNTLGYNRSSLFKLLHENNTHSKNHLVLTYSPWSHRGCWQEDLKHWTVGRSSASCFIPRAFYFASIFLPTLIFLPSSLKPILLPGLPRNSLGTPGPAKEGECGCKFWKVVASQQLFFCKKTKSFTAASTNILTSCAVSRANTGPFEYRHYHQT